jgi:hypothetical protein
MHNVLRLGRPPGAERAEVSENVKGPGTAWRAIPGPFMKNGRRGPQS